MTTPLGAPTSSTPATAAPAATPAPGRTTAPGESAMGPDAFMKLLVAQLKYQNPMAPADGQAYMTQMATFTQVEKLDQLVKAQTQALQWQQRVSAEGLVGRSVTATVDGADVSGEVVGLRYTGTGAVLELEDGRTLDPSSVQRVHRTSTPAPSSTASPTAPSTTGTTGTTSTAAPAAPPSA